MNDKGTLGFYTALIISQVWFATGDPSYGIAWAIVSVLALIIGRYK